MDATCWGNRRGYGRFARELVAAMADAAPQHVFLAFGDEAALAAGPASRPNLRLVTVRQSAPATEAAAAAGYRSPTDMMRLTMAVRRARPDVFFSPSVYTWFPLWPGQRAVVTIHDAIAERFPELTLPGRRARLFWRVKVKLALAQSRLILTVSEFAADEIMAVHRVPRARLRIAVEAPASAYHPPAPEDVAAMGERLALPPGAEWFSYVGGFSPHKRLDAVLDAFARVLSERPSRAVYLVLAGRREGDAFLSHVAELDARVEALAIGHRVRWPGFLSDAELRAVHGGAVAALLPSMSEGFGLPAVEAAACGTPVIATRSSPLPELLEGGGLFVTPGDVDGLAEAMVRMLDDTTQQAALGRTARARAAALSWERGARAAVAVLEEAAA